jgi:TRAP-type C4-dicarboxylate transport system permease small subunit
MKTYETIIKGLSRLMYWIAGTALTGIMFLTVFDVILRLFKRPILGTYEIVSLLGAVVIGFAIPQTSIDRGQVLMDFLTGRLFSRTQRALHILTRLLGIITFLIIGWNLMVMGNDLRVAGQVSQTLRIPEYPIAYGVGLCCFMECLVLLSELIQRKGEGI